MTGDPRPTPPKPPALPLELRVHGVGGPQAAKMLGEVDEHEIVTVPPFLAAPECSVPQNTTTRFARRLRDGSGTKPVGRTEAYEWGALTVATAAKALWVLYLPFTLVNAAGWAHAPVRPGRNAGLVWWHRAFTHVAALLVTLTYVGWLAYLSLDLIGRTWVDHVKTTETVGINHDFVIYWVPRLAPVVFVVVVVLLLLAPALWSNYEKVQDGTTPLPESGWPRDIRISSPAFFAQQAGYARRRILHLVIALVATVVLLVRYMVGWHRIGLMLLALAGVQAVVVFLLTIVDGWARRRVRPSELDNGALLLEAPLDDDGARFPAGATFVSVGTCLAHAAFAGLAMTLSPLLARWPSGSDDTELPVRAELGAADVLAWDILLLVVLLGLILVRSKGGRDETAAGEVSQAPTVRLARRVPVLGAAALIAFSTPVAVYGFSNISAIVRLDGSLMGAISEWYDSYKVEGGVAKQLGALVLVALPPLFYGVLRRPHESGAGRVVGNVWDVLTFWPRRFHPLAVPCSAERSVPELRARIRHVRAKNPLVVVAHSQGSVLAAAAISSLDPTEPAPGLVTFGSPLGTLYAPTWPAYIPSLLVDTSKRVAEDGAPPWVNFWRITDPIGAEVPMADNRQLHEPQALPVNAVAAIRARRPLERPPRWGTVAGHNHYLADPEVQAEIATRRGS